MADSKEDGAVLQHLRSRGCEPGPVQEVLQISPGKEAPGGAGLEREIPDQVGSPTWAGPAPAEAQGWDRDPGSGPVREAGPRPPSPAVPRLGPGPPAGFGWAGFPRHRLQLVSTRSPAPPPPLTCAAAAAPGPAAPPPAPAPPPRIGCHPPNQKAQRARPRFRGAHRKLAQLRLRLRNVSPPVSARGRSRGSAPGSGGAAVVPPSLRMPEIRVTPLGECGAGGLVRAARQERARKASGRLDGPGTPPAPPPPPPPRAGASGRLRCCVCFLATPCPSPSPVCLASAFLQPPCIYLQSTRPTLFYVVAATLR